MRQEKADIADSPNCGRRQLALTVALGNGWIGGMKFAVFGVFASMMPLFFLSVFAQAPAIKSLPKAPSPPNVKIPPRPTFIPPPPPKPFPSNGNQSPGGPGREIPPARPFVPVPPLLQWTDFTYGSPREKEFWDKIPDWTSILPTGQGISLIPEKRRDANGKALDMDEPSGYTGYAKKLSVPGQRTIYQLQNGWVTRTMTWAQDGRKLTEGTYNGGRKDGVWVAYDEAGKINSRVTYQAGQVVPARQPIESIPK